MSKERLVLAGVALVSSTVTGAVAWVTRGYVMKSAMKELTEANDAVRADLAATLKVFEIESDRALKIIEDLAKETDMSRDDVREKLKSHGLNQKQIDSVMESLIKEGSGGGRFARQDAA